MRPRGSSLNPTPPLLLFPLRRACTGGWDWAPYALTQAPAQPGTARVFSRGIWKSVYLVTAAAAFVQHVVPLTFYTGPL